MDTQPILDLAKAIFAHVVAGDASLGLAAADAESRILALEPASQGLRLRVASDGLSLTQKMNLERLLLRSFTERDVGISGINFAKTAPSTTGTAEPQKTRKQASAFGISQNKKAIPGVRHVVLVASGKGGVGKSTVSANLAVAMSKLGQRTGLMDCDVYGPSAPMLLGIRGQIQVGPGGKLIPMEGHGIKTVSFGFLSDVRSPVIWRGPLVGKAVEQLCYDVHWGDIDVLVVDMPPGTGDVQLTIAEKLPIHTAVIVTTPQDVALIDAHKAVSMFETLDVPMAGVVQNMAWHGCSACGHVDHIFGKEAFEEFLAVRRLSLLTSIPLMREIRSQSDLGLPPAIDASTAFGAPYYEVARKVLAQLGISPPAIQ